MDRRRLLTQRPGCTLSSELNVPALSPSPGEPQGQDADSNDAVPSGGLKDLHFHSRENHLEKPTSQLTIARGSGDLVVRMSSLAGRDPRRPYPFPSEACKAKPPENRDEPTHHPPDGSTSMRP